MRPIEEMTDIDELRQAAQLYAIRCKHLQAFVDDITREREAIESAQAQRKLEILIERLEERISRDQRRLYGESSERRPLAATPEQAKSLQRGHGPTPQPALPLEVVAHELSEDARACPSCGGALCEMGDQAEEYEEVTFVARRFVTVRHRRRKYRCACNAAVVTAPSPPRLVPGGRYSTEFAVEVAAAKYVDHLPLERQRKIMEREGLVVTTQALWDQLHALATLLAPAHDGITQRIKASPVVHADETWWRLMEKNSSKRWWAWSLACHDAVTYRIDPSRSAEAAGKLLDGFEGIVVADGYGAYASLARAGPKLTLVHCWAHVRRKFHEAAPAHPREGAEALDLIGKLYGIEALAPFGVDDEEKLALRKKLRGELARPIIDRLREWAYAQRASPGDGLRKAIEYMLSLWPGLVRFLDDPRVPLDNNLVERALRGPVIGRKNHYGSRSQRGTEVAALFYTLVETARLCGLDPKAYLLAAARTALLDPGAVLLPHDLLS